MVLDFMMSLARTAGEICLQEAEAMDEGRVEYKGIRDLVTPVDRKVEDFLRTEIGKRFPDHAIVGEERGNSLSGSDSCWVIDPIDGTTSYVHGLPGYSVSIALQRGGRTVAGVVYAPVLNQMFTAEQAKGACLNGSGISVSRRHTLIQAVLATGFACIRDGRADNDFSLLKRILAQVRDIRRHGSAALDLAWVAAGKMDGYWEQCLKLHDIAAGVLLVTEAGGRVCDFMGGEEYPEHGLVATNGRIGVELLRLFQAE